MQVQKKQCGGGWISSRWRETPAENVQRLRELKQIWFAYGER